MCRSDRLQAWAILADQMHGSDATQQDRRPSGRARGRRDGQAGATWCDGSIQNWGTITYGDNIQSTNVWKPPGPHSIWAMKQARSIAMSIVSIAHFGASGHFVWRARITEPRTQPRFGTVLAASLSFSAGTGPLARGGVPLCSIAVALSPTQPIGQL